MKLLHQQDSFLSILGHASHMDRAFDLESQSETVSEDAAIIDDQDVQHRGKSLFFLSR
jgi:hypothetical protein